MRRLARSWIKGGRSDKIVLSPDGSEYIPGASVTVTYSMVQKEICLQYGATMTPPFSHDYAMISDGVLEGADLEGTRYPALAQNPRSASGNLSGWWFTTDLFNGNMNTLRPTNLYHLTSQRPELARCLALPAGYWVMLSANESQISFDSDIAAQEPV